MTRAETESRTEALLEPILNSNNFELVDVEYVKEGSDFFLRAYIDKDGGITIDDCELVSRTLEAKLDEEDFIKEAYILEVSSPGLTRPLKKERDYERNMGKLIEIHTYKALDGKKEFVGRLKAYTGDDVTIVSDEENTEWKFDRKNISLIRQYFEF